MIAYHETLIAENFQVEPTFYFGDMKDQTYRFKLAWWNTLVRV